MTHNVQLYRMMGCQGQVPHSLRLKGPIRFRDPACTGPVLLHGSLAAHLAALEARRPALCFGRRVVPPCRRCVLLLRRESLLCAGPRLVLPLKEAALLQVIPGFWAFEEHPAQHQQTFGCPFSVLAWTHPHPCQVMHYFLSADGPSGFIFHAHCMQVKRQGSVACLLLSSCIMA